MEGRILFPNEFERILSLWLHKNLYKHDHHGGEFPLTPLHLYIIVYMIEKRSKVFLANSYTSFNFIARSGVVVRLTGSGITEFFPGSNAESWKDLKQRIEKQYTIHVRDFIQYLSTYQTTKNIWEELEERIKEVEKEFPPIKRPINKKAKQRLLTGVGTKYGPDEFDTIDVQLYIDIDLEEKEH